MPILKGVLAGISRSRLGRGQPSKVCLPITTTLHTDIRKELVRSAHPDQVVLWALYFTTFFGFVRLGELLLAKPSDYNPQLHLSWEDMAINNHQAPTTLRFHLKESKTDPLGRGANIILERTGCKLSPVTAVLTYAVARGSCPESFFLMSSSHPLTKQGFVSELRK